MRDVWPGQPFPLGPGWDGEGTNFSLFSENAGRVQLCLYGEEAGYRVGLVQDESGPEGSVFRVFVGRLDSNDVEAVAILPCTPEGRTDADAIGLAVLRTLEIVGRGPEDTGAA